MEKKPRIKIKIDKNGAVVADLSNFKQCDKATTEILADLNLQADSVTAKEEVTHEVEHVTVKSK
jgi:hypothetical protein